MYTTSSQSRFLILSDTAHPLYWSVQDAPCSSKAKTLLEHYIQDAQMVFAKNTFFLGDFKKTFTSDDENHLKKMFELLIDARKVWEDEFR